MYVFQQNLKHINECLKKWNRESFGHITLEKRKLEQQLEDIQTKTMKEGYSEEEKHVEKTIMQELMQREKQEEILWQQKSRKLWLREGDMNTSFFHKPTIQYRQQNWISRLESLEGQVLETQQDIEQEVVNFYTDLLNETEEDRARDTVAITRNIPKLATPEHNTMWMRPIEREEAVFQMEKGKAPGPDGFIVDFFQ